MSNKELTLLIADSVGFKRSIQWDTSKTKETPRNLLDISKFQSLGWQPQIELQEGIVSSQEWYVDN